MSKRFSRIVLIGVLILVVSSLAVKAVCTADKPVGDTRAVHIKEGGAISSPDNKGDVAEADKVAAPDAGGKEVDIAGDKQVAVAGAAGDTDKQVAVSGKASVIDMQVAVAPVADKQATAIPAVVEQTATAPTAPVAATITPSRAANKSYPLWSKVNGVFGQFRYRDTSGGRIEVDPQWVAENIVTIKLPGLNQYVQVHKEAQDNFIQAFKYIENGTATINGKQVPLLSLIKTMDGTYVPRHVNWDSSRGLSNHSWGTAIDINAADHFRYVNPGKEPYDPNYILWEKAFKPAGFSWGNSYSDSMHYELFK